MKKKLIIIGSCILVLTILATLFGPYLILALDKQEEVAKEYAYH